MYRQSLLVLLLSLFITGCYGGSSYYESDVYTRPTEVRSYYDTGYSPTYYQERRIYVAPQPRYYNPPPRVYYRAPPPPPRYYAPGRPPGHGWNNHWRGGDRDRHDRRPDYRSERRERGDHHRGDRDHRPGNWDRR